MKMIIRSIGVSRLVRVSRPGRPAILASVVALAVSALLWLIVTPSAEEAAGGRAGGPHATARPSDPAQTHRPPGWPTPGPGEPGGDLTGIPGGGKGLPGDGRGLPGRGKGLPDGGASDPGAGGDAPGAGGGGQAGPGVPSAPPGPVETAPEDLLTRMEARPPALPEQISVFLGGAPPCPPFAEPGPPWFFGLPDTVGIPELRTVCFGGFDPAKPVMLTVTPPGGEPEVAPLTLWDALYGMFVHDFSWLPGDPVGRYRFSAEQDGIGVSHEITVEHASAPRLRIDRLSVRPGGSLDLYLGGFPPNQPATLHLYGGDETTYRTSFAVRVDRYGEGRVRIGTKPDHPEMRYEIAIAIDLEQGMENGVGFSISRRAPG